MGCIDLSSTAGRAEVERRTSMSRDSGEVVTSYFVGNLAENIV